MKKTEKTQRNYLLQPRREWEFDEDHRADISSFEPTLTKQSEAEACDINNIMARYAQTGQLPAIMSQDPSYGDFSDVASFQEALGIVAHARSQFAALDAKVRQRFNNDPAEMLAFIDSAQEDPEKAKELVSLGLAIPREESPIDVLKGIRENVKPSKNAQKGDSGA